MEVIIAKIQIDGKHYEVSPRKNLLDTCLSLGIEIPHFCFHPALGSVGACRLCAVKKFKDMDDKKGRIVMSCMEPVTDGLIISVEDDEAIAFRAAVIESLMTNHPHDCPVCDEGGECHLQDMTVMTGHNYRRFDFKKRTYNNQNIGPFINHEMNRCIQCYRCVRFYRNYAGGKDLNVFGSRNNIYFGRHEDGTLENEFSGNLIEVCPTGVFTDKTLKKHFTRKWDLSNAPSICVHCSIGCNTIVCERYDSLRRIMNRYNGAVNGYFLCDRGRFGYEFVNSVKRTKKSKIRFNKNETQKEVENNILLSTLGASFLNNEKIIGIGSPRASIESNYALSILVGKENFYHGISKKEQLLTKTVLNFLQDSGVQIPSLKQIEKADVIVVLGEDLTNTAPMIALALRQSARSLPNEEVYKKGIPLWNDQSVRDSVQYTKSPVFIATPCIDKLDEIAENTYRSSYSDIANLGFAIAHSINNEAPISKNIFEEQKELADKIALTLKEANNPLIISGINCGDEEVIHAALNIATALLASDKKVMLSMVLPECNSMGLAFIPGKSLNDAVSLAESEEIDTLVILENDLYRRANKESVDFLLKRCKQIIVLDHLENETSLSADIFLPAATFAESQGTIVSNEGRAQRYYKAIPDKGQVKESWQWICEFIRIKNKNTEFLWNRFDDIVSTMVIEFPAFAKLIHYMPDADLRMFNMKIPRQTMRYSGRAAMNANISVSEFKIPQDNNSPLTFSMEGHPENPPSSLVTFYSAPGWNSVQATSNYLNEPNGSMKGGDSGVILIEPTENRNYSYFNKSSQTFELQRDEWLIVPAYLIFGSEELSSKSSAIAQRIPEPFVYMNQKDAEMLEVNDSDLIQLEILKNKFNIKVKIENSLQPGIAGLSINLPGMRFVDLPGRGNFYKIFD